MRNGEENCLRSVPLHGGPRFLPGLDLLRAAAALLVMIGHVRNLFFTDYSQVVNCNWLIKSIYFLTGLGHESVIIFFVLSGLLVGGKVVYTGICESMRSFIIPSQFDDNLHLEPCGTYAKSYPKILPLKSDVSHRRTLLPLQCLQSPGRKFR